MDCYRQPVDYAHVDLPGIKSSPILDHLFSRQPLSSIPSIGLPSSKCRILSHARGRGRPVPGGVPW